ncbi:MAG: D-alanyl-D-alanine carboxypeptidase, partial [Saprospiraceae bacterium]|nr:D-alanyl-D-alanine carboxypeptidase [Saprospiraceae bacterium]
MRHGLLLLFLGLLAACSSSRQSTRYYQRNLTEEIRNSPVFSKGITGFHLIDAASGVEYCAVQADRYFTPASNTKILTLATCLNLLGDSLPGLQYRFRPSNTVADSMVLVFRGTGDPTFLHPDFQAWQPAFALLRKHQQLAWVMEDFPPERFGPGWCWDDYSDAYSAERSHMPLYGNVIRLVKNAEGWTTHPAYFQFLLKETDGTSIRR